MWCNWCTLRSRLMENHGQKGGNAGTTVATNIAVTNSIQREINSSVPNEWRRWKRGYKMLTVFYSILTVHILKRCVLPVHWRIYFIVWIFHIFFFHSACKRNFHWMHSTHTVCCKNGYSVLSPHLSTSFSFDHSFTLFFFRHAERCIDTDSSGKKLFMVAFDSLAR